MPNAKGGTQSKQVRRRNRFTCDISPRASVRSKPPERAMIDCPSWMKAMSRSSLNADAPPRRTAVSSQKQLRKTNTSCCPPGSARSSTVCSELATWKRTTVCRRLAMRQESESARASQEGSHAALAGKIDMKGRR